MKPLIETLFTDQHRLTARRRALAVLHDLCQRHERLGLYVDGALRELPSILLEVDEEQQRLVFDIPPPVEGVVWDQREPVLALARHHGVHVGFLLEDIAPVEWTGAKALCAGLAQQVYYLQRRQYFRVPVGGGDVHSVVLVRQGAPALSGRCHDLSAGGMRVLVPAEQGRFALRAGELLPELRFALRGVVLQTEARIRHVGEPLLLPDGKSLSPLGLEFVDKSFAFDQAVVRYVQQRDRDLLSGRK